jgi:hypothetical protein
MRIAACMFLIVLLAVAGTATAREWQASPMTVADWDGRTEEYLGVASCELVGYAVASEWADEIQVCFCLPRPELHGPWLVEYIAFYMSGSGTHRVTVRQGTSLGGEPGAILAEDVEFTPLYTSWPPSDWTYVSLKSDIPCPAHLSGGEGDFVMIGTGLLPGDRIGLAEVDAGTHGWGYFGDTWNDDSGMLQMVPAVRLGISDLGTSSANCTTWGAVKDLFK